MGAKTGGRSGIDAIIQKLHARPKPGPLTPRKVWDRDLGAAIDRLLPSSDDEWPSLLKSALRLWNDDLEGSHVIAQDIKSTTGSYLHGVMHRREPDYGNSKYWFRQVGHHPLFPALRESALELAEDLPEIRDTIRETPKWDGFRMVDWCQDWRDARRVAFLEALQAREISAIASYCREKAGL